MVIRGDMPTIANSAYASNIYTPTVLGLNQVSTPMGGGGNVLGSWDYRNKLHDNLRDEEKVEAILKSFEQQQEKKPMAVSSGRRLVKVIIIDPDNKVPLEQCVLYSGKEQLTDLTDQELFFEIEIKAMLDGHNEIRKKILDKEVKERKEYLEPIKVRDLKMVVVDIAKF